MTGRSTKQSPETQSQRIPNSEATEAGEQMLNAGVRQITTHDRLTLMALRPLAPRRNPNANQKPCDLGLFDEVQRNQIDLIDFLKSSQPITPKP